jgi:hypothetical protein
LAAHFVGHSLLDHEAGGGEETMTGKLKTQIEGRRWALLAVSAKGTLNFDR